jgi:hypothetical protein
MQILLITPEKHIKKTVELFLRLALTHWQKNSPKKHRNVANDKSVTNIVIRRFDTLEDAMMWISAHQDNFAMCPVTHGGSPQLIRFNRIDLGA